MSFVGGGADCSVNGNAIAQFNKHTQQDRSLQRQTANQTQFIGQNSFKSENGAMNQADRRNMEAFMNGGGQSFQFSPMHHELDVIHRSSAQPALHQPQILSQKQNWSTEFQAHSPSPSAQQHATGSPQWGAEFQTRPELQQQPQMQNSGSPQMSMRMGYRPMMPMMGSSLHQPAPQVAAQPVSNQEQQVDWDNQFKEIEELSQTANAQTDETAQREGSPEIVVDDKYEATFQEVWDSLNDEALENDFINQQYEDFKTTQRETLPADMSQWERDFAKYASTRAHFGEYKSEDKQNNQFLDLPADQDPYEIGLQLMENGAKLSEAALAFEAAIQRDETHVDAWLKLGEVQTQNEKEIAGISALEKCLELNPENSQALMTLAISYVNEGYDNAAFATLERWISTKYPQITEKARQQNPQITDEDRFSLNKRVTELFINAAQLSPNQASMDADVQLGLGVLFYANEDFDKTIDCFKAALSIKPDDPVLWNRLGASLANSNRSEEAVDAYFKALELKPTFVRARYNLGVSCINIGCYKEAAEHLLSGLAMHQVEGHDTTATTSLSPNQSTALTETLKRAFIAMERRDLLEVVKPGMNLDQFRGEFTF
ncbi:Peroxisomal membrane signal receptor PTS1 [Yamadazyma tenuis]|uniref:Peroxisomal targeting signal receptor n=1 Tax=Candida tenuis (strain ATCC 10573 / BCRC 21748 / CBS 615 / JCM 9827 / NBRC 10315 / NRRL Y-1498 / VKM Y-70) TaxID=590646 RepID=G3B7S1_CANTC|nr:TPR-like protein [Yamadazyma tenuis ATCC 10573]EGV62307.1 TPR-like protein [Yamadazyma tenuis ATCC 10573]WEJ93565.1 Peroxisomal membrane signal receptor PTS1 [Yamadazyma tenuis]